MKVFEIFFVFVISERLGLTSCLVELSPFGDNVIVINEALIRDTVTRLLNILNTAPKNASELEQDLATHNYLQSKTHKDSENFKLIVQESRLSDTGDEAVDLIDPINEILNENNEDGNDKLLEEQTLQVIQNFINDLEYLRVHDISTNDIKKQIEETIIPRYETSYAHEQYPEIIESSLENYTNPYWTPDEDPVANSRRIYQGKQTKVKYFPFIASVLLFQMFYCAGSIISSDLIITAASCLQLAWNNRLFRENPAYISVRVGSSFHSGGGEMIPVQELYFHPSYNPKTLQNNLCIMRIARHLKFSGKKKKKIKKIMYDSHAHALPMNTPGITIIGWGAKDPGNKIKFADPLNYAVLDVYPVHDCQDVYSKQYVKRFNFCAGFISKGGGACNHDVGDPGVVDGILMGVVSFGAPICGTPDAPTVFTKLGFYADWIESIIEMVVPSTRVRTTTKPPWTPYTLTEPTTTTLIPMFGRATYSPSVADMLLSYFNHDEKLYNSFLETLKEKDTNQIIKALKGDESYNDMKTVTTTLDNVRITTPYIHTYETKNDYEQTKAEVFVDTFEVTKKHRKRKKQHKHSNQNKHFENTESTTPRVEYQTLKSKRPIRHKHKTTTGNKFVENIHNDHIESPLGQFADNLPTLDSKKSPLKFAFGMDSKTIQDKYYKVVNKIVKDPNDLENVNLVTPVASHTSKSEETSYLNKPHLPISVLHEEPIYSYFEQNSPQDDPIKNRVNDKTKVATKDEVQAAEDFFTNSILQYLSHTDIDSILAKNESDSKEMDIISSLNAANSSSESDVETEPIKSQNEIAYRTQNKGEEDYIKYLKSLSPEKFYQLMTAAVKEIEKDLKKNDTSIIAEIY